LKLELEKALAESLELAEAQLENAKRAEKKKQEENEEAFLEVKNEVGESESKTGEPLESAQLEESEEVPPSEPKEPLPSQLDRDIDTKVASSEIELEKEEKSALKELPKLEIKKVPSPIVETIEQTSKSDEAAAMEFVQPLGKYDVIMKGIKIIILLHLISDRRFICD